MATITKAAAKIAGKAKGAAKAMAGYPKIFHHLSAEHTEVSTLLKRVAGSPDDLDLRQELFPEIRKNLLAHAHAEEQEFYPVLRDFADLKTLVAQCMEEHKRIEAYMDELEANNIGDKMWVALFERMVDAVQQHVAREENDLFPRASELLSSEQSKEMYESFEDVEEREKSTLASSHY